MLKRKKYIARLLVIALSISCVNYNVVCAASTSTSTTGNYRLSGEISPVYHNETEETGVDENDITWSYEVCSDGTIAISKSDELSGDIEIPEKIDGLTVSKIEKYGFEKCTKITSVKIPSTVKCIEPLAFYACTSLENVEIPSSVTEIDSSAFENTPWLTNQRNLSPYVVVNGILINGRAATGDIVIPDNVTEIGSDAFAYIDLEHEYQYGNGAKITSVKIPEGVKKIGKGAFGNSPNLTHVEIPFTVTEIGEDAFSACTIEIEVPNRGVTIKQRQSGPPNNTNYKIGTKELREGWQSDGQNWYYIWSDGSKKTGWYSQSGNWYYFYGNGQMATGFINLGGEAYYYLDESNSGSIGIMKTGWQRINACWYYFNRSSSEGIVGMMKKGWQRIDGNWYYFYGSDGTMAHDTWIDGYYVNYNGAWSN